DAAQIQIADVAALDAALDVQFLGDAVGGDGHAGFKRGDVDEDVFGHGQGNLEGRQDCRTASRPAQKHIMPFMHSGARAAGSASRTVPGVDDWAPDLLRLESLCYSHAS